MKFVIDDKIPFVKGVLERFGEVIYLPGDQIRSENVVDADALVIRTRTKCDSHLLEGSRVKLITTATIGFDHIDREYCQKASIKWQNAPGCNAQSVVQYVGAALEHWAKGMKTSLSGKTIGVVGVGHVGIGVAQLCETLGMRVLLNDPPRAKREGEETFVSLKEVMKESDVITFHTPLTKEGSDATFHLADAGFFESLGKQPLIINTSRGEVVDNNALQKALEGKLVSDAILDVWEEEPQINRDLLSKVLLATPHIAGYSRDGKANGTKMSIQAISKFFGLGIDDWRVSQIPLPAEPVLELEAEGMSDEEVASQAILHTYPIWEDDKRLREVPDRFEYQRGHYPIRREFAAYTITLKRGSYSQKETLERMGFRVRLL